MYEVVIGTIFQKIVLPDQYVVHLKIQEDHINYKHTILKYKACTLFIGTSPYLYCLVSLTDIDHLRFWLKSVLNLV